MNISYISHEKGTIESFKSGLEYAVEYLNAVLGDGAQEELMLDYAVLCPPTA